jgi:hypothetical protein
MYKMQRLEVSGAVRRIYKSLGFKGLNTNKYPTTAENRILMLILAVHMVMTGNSEG